MVGVRRSPYADGFPRPKGPYSMPPFSPGRLATLAGAGVLVAGAIAVSPAPATAAVLTTPGALAQVAFDFFPTSGACTQVGSDATQTVPFAADGVARTAATSSSATVTHNTDASDVT